MSLEELIARLDQEGSVVFDVKVIPKASVTELAGKLADGSWKIKVAAPPEKGKANAELCVYLSGVFHVPRRNVEILHGAGSPRKRIRVRSR